MPNENKCERCLHSRPIISENGFHPICTLSPKKATKCICGIENKFREDLSHIRDDEWFGKVGVDNGRIH